MASVQDNVDIILKAVNSASAVINQVKKDLQGFDESAKQGSKATDAFNSSLSNLSGGLRSAGLALTVGITAPLTLLGKALLTNVAQIEQYKVGFDTLLDSATEGSKLLKQLSDIALKTPFTLPEITQGARQLLAYSFSASETVDAIQTLGDVAAGVGAPIGDLVYLFGTLRAQGRAYAVDIRQFANRGIPIYEQLAEVLGVAKNEVQGLVSSGKVGFAQVEEAFKNMTSEGGIFFELMDKQSKTFNGILSNLKDQFTRIALSLLGLSTEAETFGQIIEGGIFDILKDAAQGALNATQGIVDFFNRLPQSVKVATAVFAGLVAVMGPLLIILGTLGAALAAIGTTVGTVALAFLGLSAAIAAFVALKNPIAEFFTEVDEGLARDSEATFKKTLSDPIIGAVVNGTEQALFRLDEFSADVLRAQNELASGLEGVELPIFDTEKTEARLQLLVDQSKQFLQDQANARLEGLENLRESDQITEEEYDRFVEATRSKLETASEVQDSFLDQYKQWTEDVSNQGSELDLSGLEELFEEQRNTSITQLTATRDEALDIIENLNFESNKLANDRLNEVIQEQKELSDTTVASYVNLYDETKSILTDALNSENEETRKAAEARLATIGEFADAQISSAVKTYYDLLQKARAEAIAEGGIYDAKHGKILTGASAFFFSLGQYAKVGFQSLLEGTVAWANAFYEVIKGVLKSAADILISFVKVLADVGAAIANPLNIKDSIAGIVETGKGLMSDLSATWVAAVTDIGDSFSTMNGKFAEINEEFRASTGDVTLDELTQSAIDSARAAGALDESVGGATDGMEDLAGGAGDAGAASDAAKKEIEELGKSLEDLGVFSIKEGGKVVDTFDSIEDGTKKIDERIKDLDKTHEDLMNTVLETAGVIDGELKNIIENNDSIADVFHDLDKGFIDAEGALERLGGFVDTYGEIAEVIEGVKDNVDDLKKAHQDYIDSAQEGLDKLDETLQDINEKFDEMISKAGDASAEDFVKGYVDALADEKDLTAELKELRDELNQAQSEGDTDRVASLQEDIDAIEEQLSGVRDQVSSYEDLTEGVKDYSTQIEEAKTNVADLQAQNDALIASGRDNTSVAEQLKEAQAELYILMGKQQLAQEELAAIQQGVFDAQQEANLSEADFIAYQLGQELAAIEEKRQAEIKAAQDIARVQQAIVDGSISTLDLDALKAEGLSEEALQLAADAQTELANYQAKLDAQLLILDEYKAQEVAIYDSTRLELQAQQDLLESYLSLSYDRLIQKLHEVEAAAKAALAAQRAVSGGGSSGTGFATGGFTGEGSKNEVAGVVHKGEWVAPKWMVNQFRPMINALERARAGKMKGFAEGGFTAPSAPQYNQPITNHFNVRDGVDLKGFASYLAYQLRTS